MWRVPWLFPRIGPPIFPYSTILSVFGMTASLKTSQSSLVCVIGCAKLTEVAVYYLAAFPNQCRAILYDVCQFDYLGGIDFLLQMFQWMIEAFPCFLNIELRFRIILVPLDDLIPVFGIEQDTGKSFIQRSMG